MYNICIYVYYISSMPNFFPNFLFATKIQSFSLTEVVKLLKLAYEYKFVPPQSQIQKQPLEVFCEEKCS